VSGQRWFACGKSDPHGDRETPSIGARVHLVAPGGGICLAVTVAEVQPDGVLVLSGGSGPVCAVHDNVEGAPGSWHWE